MSKLGKIFDRTYQLGMVDNKEVVDSTMGDSGVVIAVEGNLTVKILDNSKKFEDMDNAGKWITDAAEVSVWAKDAVSWARARNLMTGGGDGRMTPTANASRGQVAAVIMRFCETVME